MQLILGFRAAGVTLHAGIGRSQALRRAIGLLGPGDGFVWVGINGRFAVPWTTLRRRGVRTVYYQTEPIYLAAGAPCVRYNKSVGMVSKIDELWDFSHHNLEVCGGATARGGVDQPEGAPGRPQPPPSKGAKPLTIRLIPPGYMPTAHRVEGTSPALLFFGAIDATTGRGPCYYLLKRSLGEQLHQTYSVWNDSALMRVFERYDLYLNLHKRCAPGGPVTFRHALLLSAGKLVLSDRAHPRDEAEYAGMVRFVPQARLAEEYRAMVLGSDYRAEQRRAHERFRTRFQPEAIFHRAGVYRDWGLRLSS